MTKAIYNHDYFDELYRVNNGDPWQYEQRWYEKRKRDMTLAMLPYPKFKNGIEIGCSNGVLSAELAERCEYLMCMDANPNQDRMGHRHIHGANLCFRASSYKVLGGFKPMPCHEDVDLVKRAEKMGLHITWSNQLRVVTSSRLISRVCEGFSQFLWSIERQNHDNKSATKCLRKII